MERWSAMVEVAGMVRAAAAVACAAAAGAAAAGCVDAGEPLEIVEVTVEDNPANVLSCTVRWTTSVPAVSRVEYGPDGALELVARGAGEASTEHEVFVLGLWERASFTLQPVSVDDDGVEARGELLVVDTPDLPFVSADLEVTRRDPERMQPGWTLTNLAVGDVLHPTVAVMIDPEGRIRWYYALEPIPTLGAIEVTLIEDDVVLIGGSVAPGLHPVEVDLRGRVRWQGPAQADEYLGDGWMNHTMQKLPSGHYLTMRWYQPGAVVEDEIEEFDAAGEPVWTWRAADHIANASEEHIHGNMALVDDERGVAYYHSYINNALYQIDRDSGEISWTLGEGGDFEMLTQHQWPWFAHAHAPEFQEDGSVLLYDNGGTGGREVSRLLQIAFDEQAMTAEIVWEYPGTLAQDEWFTYGWGDADRLANGNTLAVAGSLLTWDSPSRLFEVTEDGEMVWEVYVSSEVDGELGGCYMAERIPEPVEHLP